ncbi:efflux RND transporter periplasmic adaptor subunit [Leptospira sp. 85282-16]|uniref:Efflux RND transporter periplasmic adaptor subunit n=1 Tax=Leptospira montravelensis TaxID=2484961 RepID=A0ABY2LPH1_9LEPT|nr:MULTISPECIES: efflux RND transporter periplasmic adaptor subunit [Leptospira]MCT8335691.1 efflux RND transporter periplasmic adaptor subunit [Leptospira sp. 85282-16]TGK86140.1 efflux RND transporter periplasmic adaptor subunit [Leptospira montravelensis]TGK95017.1 efflux RND transporter periplasmic adaptor subunit [Leptospira montravelensis]
MKNNLKIVLVFSLIILNFCSDNKNEASKKKKVTNRSVYVLEQSDKELTINLLGTVSHKNKAEVSSKVIGRIEKIFKEQGQKVSKGEALAKVETLNLELQLKKDEASVEIQNKQIDLTRAKYIQARQRIEKEVANIEKAKAEEAEAKANLENLKRTLNNKKDLFEIGGVSETELKGVETAMVSAETAYFKAQKNLISIQVGYRPEDLKKNGFNVPTNPEALREAYVDYNTIVEKAELDMAIANLKATQANIETTKLLIKESTLLSPLDGKIAVRSLYVGETTKEGTPVFVLVDDSEVFLTFPVSEADIPKFQEGKYIEFSIDALGKEKKFKGKIAIVSPILDAQSRTAEIKVEFKNEGKKLKPGMFARGEFHYTLPDEGFLIPNNGLLLSEDKKTGKVYIVSKDKLAFSKEVSVISNEGDKFLISGPLNEGDSIILGNLNGLSDGQPWDQ